jgi:hypothetical protein
MYKTKQEIVQEYDGEWVCLVKCRKNDLGGILGGEVWAHSFPREHWSPIALGSGYTGDDEPYVFRCIAHPERMIMSVSPIPIYISERESAYEAN